MPDIRLDISVAFIVSPMVIPMDDGPPCPASLS
jgi:hypothetical protein